MSTSSFVKGLVACLLVMGALGVAIAVLNNGHSRPEGVAERWLTAVGDTTRKGVEADARKRAEKIGPMSLAKDLVYSNTDAIGRKTAFADLEVGKAVLGYQPGYQPDPRHPITTRRAEIGFRVHALRPNDKKVEITGVLTMFRHAGENWTVAGVRVGGTGVPKLPSDGGPPPSSASASLWLAGLVGAAIIGVITTSLVRLAGRGTVVPVTS